jgi:hypothetical protein
LHVFSMCSGLTLKIPQRFRGEDIGYCKEVIYY